MNDELRFQMSLVRTGARPPVKLDFVIAAPELDQMRPPRVILDGRDAYEAQRALERRDRFVQQMSANFARVFADALEAELEA